MVWRRMRAAGATSLQNGVWVLPYSAEQEKAAQDLQVYVEQQGGASTVFVASALRPEAEAHILELFQADRAEEYSEFKEQCADFLEEIKKEIKRKNFSFAEFEENEQNLNKLELWLGKIKNRDFIAGPQTAEADNLLEKCRQALSEFADQVYSSEGHKQSDSDAIEPASNEV